MIIPDRDVSWDYRPQYFPNVNDEELKPYNVCIGSTQRRRRCASSSSAGYSMPQMLEQLRATGNPSHVQLEDIAKALLCKSYHQCQAGDIANFWLKELQERGRARLETPHGLTENSLTCQSSAGSSATVATRQLWATPISSRNEDIFTPESSCFSPSGDAPAIKKEETSPAGASHFSIEQARHALQDLKTAHSSSRPEENGDDPFRDSPREGDTISSEIK